MSSEEDSSNESDEFYVDRILDSSVDDDGKVIYKIRWVGYTPEDDTWVGEDDLFCDEKLAEYQERVKKEQEKNTKKGNKSKGRRNTRRVVQKETKKEESSEGDYIESTSEEEEISRPQRKAKYRKSLNEDELELASSFDSDTSDDTPVKEVRKRKSMLEVNCKDCNETIDNEDDGIICKQCENNFHIDCVETNFEKDWYCDECLPKCAKCGIIEREPVVTCSACSIQVHTKCLDKSTQIVNWECDDCSKYSEKVGRIITFRESSKPVIITEFPKELVKERNRDYYVKWKDKSYRECSWIPGDWLFRLYTAQFKYFCRNNIYPEDVKNIIPNSWLIPQRVIDKGHDNNYLIKWNNLSYEDCTWEKKDSIPEKLVKQYVDRLKPKKKSKFVVNFKDEESFSKYMFKNSPEFLNNALYDYQLKGVNWLLNNWLHQRNSILADEMGLGKTIQTISFWGALRKLGVGNPAIIIVPLSTITNWEREFEKWLPNENVIVYSGINVSRKIIRQHEFYHPKNNSPMFDVLLTTYEILTADVGYLKKFNYSLMVIDEAHRIKNLKAKLRAAADSILSEHRLLLTGTPLQNDLTELFSIMEFLHTNTEEFKSKRKFDDRFNNIMKIEKEKEKDEIEKENDKSGSSIDEENEDDSSIEEDDKHIDNMDINELKEFLTSKHIDFMDISDKEKLKELVSNYKESIKSKESDRLENVKYLHTLLKPHFLRRLKENVLEKLPPKVEVGVPCPLSTFQKKLYRETLQKNYSILNPLNPSKVNIRNVMVLLRHICNHPYIIPDLEPESMDSSSDDTMNRLLSASGKLKLMDYMLTILKEQNHRALIFSQSVLMLDILEDYIRWRNFTFERIDGSTPQKERQAAADRFNEENGSFLFIISTHAGGLGLNLTGADTVFIYDSDFNPQNDLQALSRAHRIGQTKPVIVYRLFCRNSIDQVIIERSTKKLILDYLVIGNMEKGLKSKEINEMLRYGAKKLFENENDDEDEVDIASFDEGLVNKLLDREKCIEEYKNDKKESHTPMLNLSNVWKPSDEYEDSGMDDNNFWENLLKDRVKQVEEQKRSSIILGKRKRKVINYKTGVADEDLIDGDFIPEIKSQEEDSDTEDFPTAPPIPNLDFPNPPNVIQNSSIHQSIPNHNTPSVPQLFPKGLYNVKQNSSLHQTIPKHSQVQTTPKDANTNRFHIHDPIEPPSKKVATPLTVVGGITVPNAFAESLRKYYPPSVKANTNASTSNSGNTYNDNNRFHIYEPPSKKVATPLAVAGAPSNAFAESLRKYYPPSVKANDTSNHGNTSNTYSDTRTNANSSNIHSNTHTMDNIPQPNLLFQMVHIRQQQSVLQTFSQYF